MAYIVVMLTASKLRENIYRVLDDILRSGQPVEVERRGKRLRIAPVDPPRRMVRLLRRPIIKGSAESLVHRNWSAQWKPRIK